MITNRKFKFFVVLSIILLGFTACSSGNDLITTKKQLIQMTTAMNSYMLKNGYEGMSKEELCVVMSDSFTEGLAAANSSFQAMNSWIREYKDPRMGLFEQTYTAQVAQLIVGQILEGKVCEPKNLTGDIAKFVGYVKENVYDRAENEKRKEKERKAADEAKFGPELKGIMAEMKGFESRCISTINTDYSFINGDINERMLISYRETLASSRKCQEKFLLKQKAKEAAEHAKIAEEKALVEAKVVMALKTLNEARKKIQILDQQCVKSNYMLNMFQTSEYEHAKKSITGGYTGDVNSYTRSVNQHIAASKCKPS